MPGIESNACHKGADAVIGEVPKKQKLGVKAAGSQRRTVIK